ncbi:MAG: transketolase C-terminal domain-containing protein [Leptolyngbyaceae bacterium]|nr:transketolase C-terminal domain-containing protein [Leptolyngbyaceae bacterium]
MEQEYLTYKESARRSMHALLANFDDTILLGQGVSDPIGIFGTTLGLIKEFGSDRVFEMPIAEESMAGIAIGLSLNGFYPIQTHIRADFMLLSLNQLINSAAKYRYMYGGMYEVPMLIRAVIGRSWGQGPQHSQSIQSTLSHFPGLTVIMPSSAQQLEAAYLEAREKRRGPVISLEHRLLYDYSFNIRDRNPAGPTVARYGTDVTIVATSIMVIEALRAAEWVFKHHQISCEVIDLHRITNIDIEIVIDSLKKTSLVIIADTGYREFGVAAELVRLIVEQGFSLLGKPPEIVTPPHCPTPTSHALEQFFYPTWGLIVEKIYKLLIPKFDVTTYAMPSRSTVAESYLQFKGPF